MIKPLIQLLKLPTISDDCRLVVAEASQLSFPIKRVYYIYGAKAGLVRGLHAHKKTHQVLFCVHGSVQMKVDDGHAKKSITLNKPNVGIVLPPMLWHEMAKLTPETILLVFASKTYDPRDYIRNYDTFKQLVRKADAKS